MDSLVLFQEITRLWNHGIFSAGTDIVFGECKYTNEPMDTDVFYRLQEKKKNVQWKKASRREYFVFFSINGYTRQMWDLAASKENILLLM